MSHDKGGPLSWREFLFRVGVYTQRMNFCLHHVAKGIVYFAVAIQQSTTLEGIADDGHGKVSGTAFGALMAGVQATFIHHFQVFRRQRGH